MFALIPPPSLFWDRPGMYGERLLLAGMMITGVTGSDLISRSPTSLPRCEKGLRVDYLLLGDIFRGDFLEALFHLIMSIAHGIPSPSL